MPPHTQGIHNFLQKVGHTTQQSTHMQAARTHTPPPPHPTHTAQPYASAPWHLWSLPAFEQCLFRSQVGLTTLSLRAKEYSTGADTVLRADRPGWHVILTLKASGTLEVLQSLTWRWETDPSPVGLKHSKGPPSSRKSGSCADASNCTDLIWSLLWFSINSRRTFSTTGTLLQNCKTKI